MFVWWLTAHHRILISKCERDCSIAEMPRWALGGKPRTASQIECRDLRMPLYIKTDLKSCSVFAMIFGMIFGFFAMISRILAIEDAAMTRILPELLDVAIPTIEGGSCEVIRSRDLVIGEAARVPPLQIPSRQPRLVLRIGVGRSGEVGGLPELSDDAMPKLEGGSYDEIRSHDL